MNPRKTTAITLASATIIGYAAFGQQSQPPRTLVLDGEPVATWNHFNYNPETRTVVVDTDQELFGCQSNVIFSDRFQND